MDKIQIVSWLLTRRCNLRCEYCALVRNYKGKPDKYPDMKHYHQHEMSTEYILEVLAKIKEHNPNAFHILYGGEPLLRKDLAQIVNFCNENDIHYTIISNNSKEIMPMFEDLMVEVDHINGYTASVDPVIVMDPDKVDPHRLDKSLSGYAKLLALKNLYGKELIKDPVAEITVDNESVPYLHKLVSMLSEAGISSDITFVDIAKSPYYDFSNVFDESQLVEQSDELSIQFDKIIDDKLDVHMADKLLPAIWKILPADMDCGIEHNVHNMTIDADGTVRLCLRIRGLSTPMVKAIDAFGRGGKLNPFLKQQLKKDKVKYCRGCNWTCMLMSQIITKQSHLYRDLVHTERRE